MNRNPITVRRSGGLAAAAVLLLTLLAALGGPASASAPATTGWIRAAHLAPGTPKADVVLSPFEGGRSVELTGVSYSDVTDYARVPTGLYTVDVRAAGAARSTSPMVSATVRVTKDAAITVVASGATGDVMARAVYDDLRPPSSDKAKVRLISAVPGTEVTARVADGPLLAQDVTTGSATGYAQVAAQTWSVEVTTTDGKTTRGRVPVSAGGVYTLLAVSSRTGGVELQAVQDSAGSGVMPRGGADTGGGGLATAAAAPASAAPGGLPWSAVALVVGGVLGLMGLVRRAAR